MTANESDRVRASGADGARASEVAGQAAAARASGGVGGGGADGAQTGDLGTAAGPHAATLEGAPALRARNDPLGWVGWATAGMVAFALSLMAGLWHGLGPARRAIAAVADRGEVAALAPATTAERLAEPTARRLAYLAARRAALAHYRAHAALLEPIASERPSSSPALGLARLAAWADLKRAWAEALAGEGLAPADYHALAREVAPPTEEACPPLDLLLGPPEGAARGTRAAGPAQGTRE